MIILVFILGASTGSFISVVNDRIKKGKKGIIFGRSACPHCRKRLSSYDLIPLASYFLLKGKCRYCHKKISSHYPALEIISALIFVTLYLKFPFFNETAPGYGMDLQYFLIFLIFGIYAVFFVAIFFYDLQHSEIPDLYLFPFIAVALLGSLIMGQPVIYSMAIAVGISLLFFGGQYLISKGKWLGEGDIYLAISIALILGWKLLLIAIAAAYFIGSVISIILLLSKKASGKTQIPFAPFLILGSLITIFFGQEMISFFLGYLTP